MYKNIRYLSIGDILKIINITFIILIILFLKGKTLGYAMIIDNKLVGYIKNKNEIHEYYDVKLQNTNIDSREVVKVDEIDFRLSLMNRENYLLNEEAKTIIDEEVDTYVEAYDLSLDDISIGKIDNKEVYQKVKQRLTDYYIDVHNLKDVPINWVKIKEDVKLTERVVNSEDIISEDELYNLIIESNENNNTIATVEIVARKTFLENNSGNKIQVMALSNCSNENNKYNKNNFDKEVVNEITYNNDKFIGSRNISTKNLRSVVSEVHSNGLLYLNNPSKNNVITSPFGLRWGGEKHHGIDIAGNIGDPIFAAESGFASSASYNSIYGNYIKLNHGKGIETLYGHCDIMLVKEGEYVTKGQIIGKIGNTGRSTGPHLHFEVRVNGKADNPLNYVAY